MRIIRNDTAVLSVHVDRVIRSASQAQRLGAQQKRDAVVAVVVVFVVVDLIVGDEEQWTRVLDAAATSVTRTPEGSSSALGPLTFSQRRTLAVPRAATDTCMLFREMLVLYSVHCLRRLAADAAPAVFLPRCTSALSTAAFRTQKGISIRTESQVGWASGQK